MEGAEGVHGGGAAANSSAGSGGVEEPTAAAAAAATATEPAVEPAVEDEPELAAPGSLSMPEAGGKTESEEPSEPTAAAAEPALAPAPEEPPVAPMEVVHISSTSTGCVGSTFRPKPGWLECLRKLQDNIMLNNTLSQLSRG